ncbi:DUF3768 domain-containing protein [Novosphingobium beihaiensis]|uniref:DUF3768 domain-containing protein n=1 Tax=Novosphingobium beihaiensis TaxID=2930389 RepID=A0ABT0BVD6_9SPHN|nr:DUF3768 domain-containing protein [Novosphingobium beihaiensis]MCJ2189028.1 DUF3768 domain-containing protein [Novosphingobium beihaiensis]
MRDEERRAEIARLNDQLRCVGVGGRIVITSCIAALPLPTIMTIYDAVRNFDRFNKHNDPYGERDCASLMAAGHHVIWKIDYYCLSLRSHAKDPADARWTRRVLTIMLADEC